MPPPAPHPVHISEMLQTQTADTIKPLIYRPDNLIEMHQDGLNTMSDMSRNSQKREYIFGEVTEETTEQPWEADNNGQGNNGGSTYQGYTSKGNYSTLEDAKLALDDLTKIPNHQGRLELATKILGLTQSCESILKRWSSSYGCISAQNWLPIIDAQ